MPQPMLVAGARTPIGRLLGSLSALSAPQLAGSAIAAALQRAGIVGGSGGRGVHGERGAGGSGLNPARLAAARGGLPIPCPRLRSTSCACPG